MLIIRIHKDLRFHFRRYRLINIQPDCTCSGTRITPAEVIHGILNGIQNMFFTLSLRKGIPGNSIL